MLEKVKEIEIRFEEVNELLVSPEVMNDQKAMRDLGKQFKELSKIVECGKRYKQALNDLKGAKEALENESDEEFREMAKEEIGKLEPLIVEIEDELRNLLIPKDKEDSLNVLLEIRAGTGGDEACLFAADLLRMYQRYCEQKGWTLELNSVSEGSTGGFKEILGTISGEDCYGTLKFESGAHRVQRVPATEAKGRIHTSAATVVILPEPDEDIEIELNMSDIKKETFCASGNGGQSVNTTYSAVRLTHLPSGIVVSMQDERSQLKNMDKAIKVLKTRLYDLEYNKRMSETAALRKSLVSTGDRSAKIRTYNFPESRVTDHRINLTIYNLPAILDGNLDQVIEPLRIAENTNRLKEGTLV